MLSTTPNFQHFQSKPVYTPKSPSPAVLLGLLPGKGGLASVASTRATSPSSSTSSSEDTMGAASHSQRKPTSNGEIMGALARRRGRNVLMLSELVMDMDGDGLPEASPSASAESSSSSGVACGTSKRCTPCTPQMVSFSPAPATAGGNQKSELSITKGDMLPPRPAGGDASQRSHARVNRLCGAAANGDASQRTPAGVGGRISLGIAVLGGDASQRSPPGCLNVPRPCSARKAVQQISAKGHMTDYNLPLKTCDVSGGPQGVTSTCPSASTPDSSRSSSVKDASQRSPAGNVPAVLKVDGCSDALKSWLSGTDGSGYPVDGVDLAERLRAAAPESYED